MLRQSHYEEPWVRITNFWADTIRSGSRSTPSRILYHLPAQEDRPACIWRFSLRELREGPCRTGFLDRGAEDCEEGAQGVSAGQEVDGDGRRQQWKEPWGMEHPMTVSAHYSIGMSRKAQGSSEYQENQKENSLLCGTKNHAVLEGDLRRRESEYDFPARLHAHEPHQYHD